MPTPRLLIVEDEKNASKALERKFSNSGFDVTVAMNGEEALDHLNKGTFDAILLDLLLPKIDGYEVLKELQTRNSKIPIIVLTNLGADSDIEKSKELGAREHYVKSMTPMKLIVARMKEILGLPPSPSDHDD